MSAKILNNIKKKALVVGPIYDQIDKLNKIISIKDHYEYIILNGGICYPNDNLIEVNQRIDYLQHYQNDQLIYNINCDDLKLAQKLYSLNIELPIVNWIWSNPNVTILEFKQTQSNVIITGGGWAPGMTKETLKNNIETSFISKLHNISWHERYGGLYGYIISNNPLTLSPPKFYNFSAQIGNQYSENVQVYGQEVDCFGLKNTILF